MYNNIYFVVPVLCKLKIIIIILTKYLLILQCRFTINIIILTQNIINITIFSFNNGIVDLTIKYNMLI